MAPKTSLSGGGAAAGITLGSPVTHTDWLWRVGKRFGSGRESVRHILDRCRDMGWKRLYWRVFDGGRAIYNSALMDSVGCGWDADNYHACMNPGKHDWSFLRQFSKFDSLGEAVDYGHRIGLEIHAWLSINEDDHGWGLISRFCRENPHFRWMKHTRLPYNSQLSFGFEAVREYKLALVKEILAYDVDGLFLDWIRTGDVRNEPQATPCGTGDFGYELPLVEGFRKKFGIDPFTLPNDDERWVRLRTEPQTLFMRAAHKLIRRKSARLAISFMGHHPWSYRGATPRINGNYLGLFVDLETWVKERLVDEVVAAGYYVKGGTPEKAFRYMAGLVKGRCPIWLYWWTPQTAEEFRKSIKTAGKLGASQVLYWESDYVDAADQTAAAAARTQAMSAYGV